MSDKSIIYNFASRSRPEKLKACLENIKAMSASENYDVVIKIDSNDPADYSWLLDTTEYAVMLGLSRNKIHAINRDFDPTGYDIIVNMSDDMWFIAEGFDNVIRQHCGPDDFVHFPDGFVNERLSTMSIMGIDYYNRFGYIYHPDYTSLWCDNEAQDVAQKLGRYKYVPEHIFEHRHPQYGKAPTDAQYRKTESYYHADRVVYNHRKKKGFPI
jgi:hypothetical protein